MIHVRKRLKNIIFYLLAFLVIFETWALFAIGDVNGIKLADAERRIEGYASTTAILSERLDRYIEANKELAELNDKYVKANIEIGNLCKRYCPPGSINDPK